MSTQVIQVAVWSCPTECWKPSRAWCSMALQRMCRMHPLDGFLRAGAGWAGYRDLDIGRGWSGDPYEAPDDTSASQVQDWDPTGLSGLGLNPTKPPGKPIEGRRTSIRPCVRIGSHSAPTRKRESHHGSNWFQDAVPDECCQEFGLLSGLSSLHGVQLRLLLLLRGVQLFV